MPDWDEEVTIPLRLWEATLEREASYAAALFEAEATLLRYVSVVEELTSDDPALLARARRAYEEFAARGLEARPFRAEL